MSTWVPLRHGHDVAGGIDGHAVAEIENRIKRIGRLHHVLGGIQRIDGGLHFLRGGRLLIVAGDLSRGPVAGLVGNEGGVVSGVINLESSGVEASDWRPRHDEHYHEA